MFLFKEWYKHFIHSFYVYYLLYFKCDITLVDHKLCYVGQIVMENKGNMIEHFKQNFGLADWRFEHANFKYKKRYSLLYPWAKVINDYHYVIETLSNYYALPKSTSTVCTCNSQF